MLVARVCEQPAGAQAMLRCGIPARLNKTVLHELAVQLTRPDGCPTVQQVRIHPEPDDVVCAL